ncbi:MAG: YIP1 family protein [Gemmatimonadota bacterium]|nr:YIP1 family protein [Gemmatimonadota bacterium]MDH3366824.1 YIP1 family protein [Gemmatimonadota bacterium]MDH3478757.1 YIP1 family protein [Gemmatimonadota bacterium]MDH3570237.1 YIP1 family protein [Gemmatimonadota bacterium]MDH5548917.1 YIP1 family protein [Gemmatimonadota bacterium]
MQTFGQRLINAAKLDVATYEEVEADSSALPQAMVAVVLASIAAGIGTTSGFSVVELVVDSLGALVAWFIWALLTYAIGTKLLAQPQTKADLGQMLRTIGFASAPGMLRVLGVVPVVGNLLVLAASLWMLAAMVVAVRQALDYTSTGRALAVCLVGFVVLVVTSAVLGGLLLFTS